MRRSLALLPLPFCISLSLAAHAASDRPVNYNLCPVEDAVPVFEDMGKAATAGPVTDEQRSQLPTDIKGDAVSGIDGASTTINGNVALTRGDQFLGADHLTYDSNTEKYSAQGNVRYQDAGMRMVADSAEGDQAADSHTVRNVRYQLIERRGNGGAEQLELQGAQGALYDSTYSTCPPSQRAWELQADRIDVNTDEGFGTARNAVLRVGKFPVLYVPVFTFPIDDRRRTGLLYPVIGLNSRNGFDWRQPIYFNIAPNFDDTLEPRLMTNRGLMLSNEFRYLTPTGRGTLNLSYLPSDRLTSRERDEEDRRIAAGEFPAENRREEDRGRLSFQGAQNLGQTWQARSSLNWISDPRYLDDFSSSIGNSSATYLRSSVGVYGRGRYWNGGLSADRPQLADYLIEEYRLPYSRLPRAFLFWDQPLGNLFSVGATTEAVRFAHVSDEIVSTRLADGSRTDLLRRPGGTRIDLKPYISVPLQGTSWFVTPTLAWRYTAYDIGPDAAIRIASARAAAAAAEAGQPATSDTIERFYNERPTRSLPIASIDAGLFFDRDTSIGSKSFLQTLEPRLFYLNVPYRNQDALPLFDTSPLTFSYGQLFRDNRFTGADRQTDANQLTLAVTSRLIRQSDGNEKLALSLGQIRYFEDSRVGTSPTAPIVEQGQSSWVAEASYAINDRWSMNAAYQWDPKFGRKDLASFRTRYLVGDRGVVNFGYRYRRSTTNIDQVDFSFLYPISGAWSIVGRYYYSLEDRQLLEAIGGVQWDSCCLAARVVTRRYVRRSGELNNQLQFELEFKGLGSAGADTERRLRRAILGYERDDLYLVPPPDLRGAGSDDDDNSLQDPTTL